ncbi:hypothetical protein K438DRAFT_1747124 [Mycena galopus ATCC 62051]|nr:hypothetical protein K438DRAFT_1747124 [Mycena galopus ATCC 62051]
MNECQDNKVGHLFWTLEAIWAPFYQKKMKGEQYENDMLHRNATYMKSKIPHSGSFETNKERTESKTEIESLHQELKWGNSFSTLQYSDKLQINSQDYQSFTGHVNWVQFQMKFKIYSQFTGTVKDGACSSQLAPSVGGGSRHSEDQRSDDSGAALPYVKIVQIGIIEGALSAISLGGYVIKGAYFTKCQLSVRKLTFPGFLQRRAPGRNGSDWDGVQGVVVGGRLSGGNSGGGVTRFDNYQRGNRWGIENGQFYWLFGGDRVTKEMEMLEG